ncbi:MAG: DUF4129 domain-containing protein [Candidatus Acetothermia bacterium]
MRSKTWNSLSNLLPVLLFSVTVFILIKPWFGSLSAGLVDSTASNVFPLWIVALTSLSALLGRRLAELEGKCRILVLISYIGVNLLLLHLLNWPLSIYVPFTLISVFFGLRFRLYFTTIDIRTDLALGTVLMLLNLLAMRAGITAGIGTVEIIVFFMAALSLSLFFHLLELREKGFDPQFRLSYFLLLLSGGLVIVAAFVVGSPFGQTLVRTAVELFRRAYLLFANLLVFLLYPLLWLLRPLMNFLENLNLGEPPEPGERELPQPPAELEQGAQEPGGISFPFAPYIFWGVLCLLLILLVVWIARKLADYGETEGGEGGMTQESESIFSARELASRFKRQVRSLQETLTGGGFTDRRKLHLGDSPIATIRRTYYNFATEMKETLPFHPSTTPRDYLRGFQDRENFTGAEEELATLTEIYNKARYGMQASSEDAKQAENLWTELKQMVVHQSD